MQVMDYDKLSKDDVIGAVNVGSGASESGQKHWATTLLQKGLTVSNWHKLETGE